MEPPRTHTILLGIILLSFLFPLGYSFFHRIEPVVDARSYDAIAVNLVEGYGFKEDRTLSYDTDPSIIRAGPLYEFFLAGVYALFGHHLEAVWVLQALLHALTALLIFLTARTLFPERGTLPGLIAAALIGFHPDLIEVSAMLMTETLYLFLVTLTVFIFAHAYVRPTWVLASLLGASAGLSILIRPPVFFFIPVFLFFFIEKKQYRGAVLFLLALLALLLPWTIRNYHIYRQVIPTTLVGEYNLWVGNTLLSDGGQLSSGENPVTTYLETKGAYSLKQKARHEFRMFMIEHPVRFMELVAIRTIRYMSLIRPMGFWFYQTGAPQLVFIVLSASAIAVLFITGFAGLWRMLREKREIGYYLAALALAAPLPLIMSVVQSRYRFQIYPLLALFGGYFFAILLRRIPGAMHDGLSVAGLLLTVSLLDVSMFLPTILERLSRFL